MSGRSPGAALAATFRLSTPELCPSGTVTAVAVTPAGGFSTAIVTSPVKSVREKATVAVPAPPWVMLAAAGVVTLTAGTRIETGRSTVAGATPVPVAVRRTTVALPVPAAMLAGATEAVTPGVSPTTAALSVTAPA